MRTLTRIGSVAVAVAAVGAGSLVFAGSAMAAPVAVPVNGSATITAPWTDGFACGAQGVTWVAKLPGKQDAVTLSTTNPCTMTGLSVTVTDNAASKKKNAVVKLIGTNGSGATSVLSFPVHVGGKPGKPANNGNGKGNS